MDDQRINLLKDHFDLNPDPRPNPWALGKYFFLAILLGAFVGIGCSFALTRAELAASSTTPRFIRAIAGAFGDSGDRALEGEGDDRINILLMGNGGAGHDGPDLTDTLIFASLRPSQSQVGMMSIPRDLAIPIPGYGWRKINHANYFGELEDPGHGARYASEVIGDVIDQNIHYYLRIDFEGFAEFIDALGGVDVYVENSFTDPQYPTSDYLTQVVQFEEGWQTMDGETALQFARSRHGNNGEGSDFARSRRQQKILLAVKDELLSAKTIFNPRRVTQLINTVNDNIETNLTTWEILRLAQVAGSIDQSTIRHHVLDASADSPLYQTNLNGAYVLLPDNDNWSGVQSIAANLFDENPSSFSPEVPVLEEAPLELVKLRIENGTAVNGLAFRTSQLLEGQGYETVSIGNAEERDWTKTIIYDFSEGAYPDQLSALQTYLEADVETTATGWLLSDDVEPRSLTLEDEGVRDGSVEDTVDFLIILGQDAANLANL